MRIAIFCHSLVSDWNHPPAHFLRGIASELIARGHDVRVYEPETSESRLELLLDQGSGAVQGFATAYPMLESRTYELSALDLDRVLADCDVVLVHEWSDSELVARIGTHHAAHDHYVLLFHDGGHRAVTDPARVAALDLRHFDAALTGSDAISHLYVERGWTRTAWTWLPAADVRVFYPHGRPPEAAGGGTGTLFGGENDRRMVTPLDNSAEDPARRWAERRREGDLVWIGNGDAVSIDDLDAFLVTPVRRLGLRAAVYGVHYSDDVLMRLAQAGIEYRGWLANYLVPEVFAQFAVTLHVPRSAGAFRLPALPSSRPFEALACGIPLVWARGGDGAPFTAGADFLVADDRYEMTERLEAVLTQPRLRTRLAERGLRSIHGGHTCAHRIDELLEVVEYLIENRNRGGRRLGVMTLPIELAPTA